MKQGYFALPGEFYTYALIVPPIPTTSALVVWPMVWSENPSCCMAAYLALDRIPEFFRPTRPEISAVRTTVYEACGRASC